MVRPPYPAAVRLCLIASERWDELRAAYYQINLVRQRPHAYAGLVYAWCVERIDPEKRDDWESELIDLLPWQDTTSEAAASIESESFMGMMAKGQ